MTTELTDPPILTEFPFNIGMRLLAPGNIRPTPQQRDDYQRFTRMDDPLADKLVAMFRRLPTGEGRKMFDTAVEHGIEAVAEPPVELVAFFEHVDSVPFWVDQKLMERATRVIARSGVVANFCSLAMFALMGGYLAARADKTLVGTGDLNHMAPRRVAETLSWTVDVTRPGGMARFHPGFKNTLRVRLMHALVRAGMNRREDWDYDKWDRPINQSTLAGTLMLFSLANIVGSQALGLHFSRKEKEAVYHLWRYIGFVLGVDQEVLPTNELDTWRLFWLQADYEFHPDDDSRKLAQALMKAVGPVLGGTEEGSLGRARRFVVTNFMCSYSRIILGRSNADFLGLPDSKVFQGLVVGYILLNRLSEVPRRLIPGLSRVRERIGRRGMDELAVRSMAQHTGDRSFGRHDGMSERSTVAA